MGAVLLIAVVAALVQDRDDASEPTPVELATGFLKAYAAFDVDRMRTYLADDATISSLGSADDPRLLVALLKATGYRQFLDSCKQTSNSNGRDSGPVHCTFAFHALRSAEIGRGPFSGGVFDVAVTDGKIVYVTQDWEIRKFSPEVWEPFARWVSKTHPEDAAVMYTDASHSGVRLSDESIRLWERNTRAYVDE